MSDRAATEPTARSPRRRFPAPVLDRFYGVVGSELLSARLLFVLLSVSVGIYALSHALVALVAGLLGRALAVAPALAQPVPRPPGLDRLPSSAGSWSAVDLLYVGLAATFVKALSSISLTFAETRLGATVGQGLRSRAVQALLARGPEQRCSDEPPPSAPLLLAAVAVRIREIEAATIGGILGGARAMAQLVPLAVCLAILSPGLAAAAAVALTPFAVLLSVARRRWRQASEQAQSLVEALHVGVDELLRNLDLWRTYGIGAFAHRVIIESGERAGSAAARVEASRAALSGANEVLAALALLGLVALSSAAGLPLGNGQLIAFAAVLFMAYRPLRDLGDARAWSLRGSVAFAALEQLTGAAEEHADGAPAMAPPARPRASGGAAPTGGLAPETLEGWSFGARLRGPRTSFRVAPGEILCIKGPTGSGKTTLLRALLGLEASAGELRYGDRSLMGAPVGTTHRPFAWVPQDAPLLTATLLDNVALFTGDRRHAAACLAQVGGEELLERTGAAIIGPGGRPLSGGERRQVALARALATGQPILLLDEPTEGLDPQAEARVLTTLARLRGQRTMILVTHRSGPAAVADRILPIGGFPDGAQAAE